MNIAELMTKNPVTIQQDVSLRTALETMERIGCHHLPVLNPHGALVGIITSQDTRHALNMPSVSRHHWRDNKLIDHILVSTVMTLAPLVVEDAAPAEDAITLMLDKQIGSLPVLRDGKLVGIVTTSDILRAFMQQLKRLEWNV